MKEQKEFHDNPYIEPNRKAESSKGERKERKQSTLMKNRAKITKDSKRVLNEEEGNSTKTEELNLLTMIKQLTETFKKYEEATQKEIKNIKEIIDAQYKISIKQQWDMNRLEKAIEKCYIKAKEAIKVTESNLKNSNESNKVEQTRYKMDEKTMRNLFIHNQWRYKNRLAMIQYDVDKLVRVLVIPRYKFNRYTQRWTKEYMVQSMEETMTYKNFFQRNKQFIITGKTNILKVIRKHQEIKMSNMREYRIRNLITETNNNE